MFNTVKYITLMDNSISDIPLIIAIKIMIIVNMKDSSCKVSSMSKPILKYS